MTKRQRKLALKTIKEIKASKSDKEAMRKQINEGSPYMCFALLGTAKRLGIELD